MFVSPSIASSDVNAISIADIKNALDFFVVSKSSTWTSGFDIRVLWCSSDVSTTLATASIVVYVIVYIVTEIYKKIILIVFIPFTTD